ncbi:MAG: T9SS C-terminal target domain-containing protein, partial [Marinilabiliales bacterium]
VPEAEEDPLPETVVDIIVGSDDHETLAAAVTAADLVETLQGEGPFTVFAPTDAAFAALPDGLLDDLLADPSGDLTDILLYHVVGAKAMSTDLSDGQEITTVFGADIVVTINQDGVFINDAQVTVADLEAQNGVVHVIDAVLVPEVTSAERIIEFRQMDATIYPNPAREYVNISFQLNDMQNVTMEIYSITGEKISDTNLGMLPAGDNTISKSVSDFRTGSYIVRLRANTESVVLRLQVVN